MHADNNLNGVSIHRTGLVYRQMLLCTRLALCIATKTAFLSTAGRVQARYWRLCT